MTYTKRLKRLDQKHALACIFKDMIRYSIPLFAAVIILALMGNTIPIFQLLLFVVSINAFILTLFLTSKRISIYCYLKDRDLDFQKENIDKDALSHIIAFILHSKNHDFSSSQPQDLRILWHEDKQKVTIDCLALGVIKLKRITLTQEEASMIALCLSPKGGSWSFEKGSMLSLSLTLPTLSAHQRMQFLKMGVETNAPSRQSCQGS